MNQKLKEAAEMLKLAHKTVKAVQQVVIAEGFKQGEPAWDLLSDGEAFINDAVAELEDRSTD
jgi:hypothetical protein